ESQPPIAGTPSLQNASAAPMTPAHISDRAFCSASTPEVCIDRNVSAVAIPEGNGNWSILISCRLSGIAMNTPRNDTADSHAMIPHHSSVTRALRYRAGSAEPSPADDIYPAALAALDIV